MGGGSSFARMHPIFATMRSSRRWGTRFVAMRRCVLASGSKPQILRLRSAQDDTLSLSIGTVREMKLVNDDEDEGVGFQAYG
jgi:hypothetical protein